MDDEQSLLNEPEPEPRPNAAAEAFTHLSERVAAMEERLDGRMAVMARALEHIAIEKQSLEFPDYGPTLAKMNGYLATLAGYTQKIMDAPAMQLTPESMAERIDVAADAARATDKATIKKSLELHHQAQADQMRAIGTIRTKEGQRWHTLYCGGGAALAISLLWLMYPGWAASIGPQSWLWPERVARRTLGEPTLWDAGIRLMRAGNPEGWRAIVDAVRLTRENRGAFAACQKAAAKTKGQVSCTITVRM
ncbi:MULTISPECIES: DUF6118 family protein [unclassified Sphingobium]|uniref:DUF6118 family protein n=1 Tax=unclassified Sphingobium TaxID=2611147 RepID=UPI000D15561D|nr:MULTISPECIES: DUF6118 family protein [unclassified Sphingobium]MBG6117704.1 hypothetical protein [Sphingobium sp. JAI105]PSO12774.1 hypothetical protein C7E20_06645 [Sphingobium sp. AEW4]TWD09973.1 hypothetical protein FB595_104321 [Sphingobium sp. AEW010]TWD26644.1 hypothetical protein FB596_104321 [Sphingobium sp. AEW013]TWD27587.1 hypothetical protein FB594_1057 [Sphingobium sp. AEW001]